MTTSIWDFLQDGETAIGCCASLVTLFLTSNNLQWMSIDYASPTD